MKPLTPSTGTAQSLAGKVALITGGSRGIGRAIDGGLTAGRSFDLSGSSVRVLSDEAKA